MRIQVERGETLVFDRHFTERTIYAGRQENCQIQLASDETVAGRHLMILEDGGTWYVEPLHDHYHRSYLDGQMLHDRQPIKDGGEIVAGDFKIRVFPSDRVEDREIAVQVIARGKSELAATQEFRPEDMGLSEGVIVKSRADTYSLSRGRIEYISGLALRLADYEDVRALMSEVIDAVLEDFQANCVWIGLRTDEQGHLYLSAGKNLFGQAIDPPPLAQECAYAVCECGRAVLYQETDKLPGRSAIAAPLVSPDGSLGMVYMESVTDRPRFTVPDVDTLVFLGTQMAIALDKLLRAQTKRLGEMKSLDQELARKVQARMAPWQLPQWPQLRFAILSEPGTGDCTDFYDVVPMGENHATILVGHTGSSERDTAITIAEICAGFRLGAVHRDAPQVLMRMLNWMMFSTGGEPRRISAGIVSIEPESGNFVLCLAGDVNGYLVDAHGRVTKVETRNPHFVGEARKAKYDAVQGRLAPSQTLALCTRGLFKLRSAEGQSYSEEQLMDLLADIGTQASDTILGDLADDISAMLGGQKSNCDITMLILRRENPAGQVSGTDS